jgi:hypothetical protein
LCRATGHPGGATVQAPGRRPRRADAELKARPRAPAGPRIDRLESEVGGISVDNELLEKEIDRLEALASKASAPK